MAPVIDSELVQDDDIDAIMDNFSATEYALRTGRSGLPCRVSAQDLGLMSTRSSRNDSTKTVPSRFPPGLSSPCWSASTGPPSNRSCASSGTPCTVVSLSLHSGSSTIAALADISPQDGNSAGFRSDQPRWIDVRSKNSFQKEDNSEALQRVGNAPASMLPAVISGTTGRCVQDASSSKDAPTRDTTVAQLNLEQMLWPETAGVHYSAVAKDQGNTWASSRQSAHQLKPATAVAFSEVRSHNHAPPAHSRTAKALSALTQLFPEAFAPATVLPGNVGVGMFPHQESTVVRES